MEKIVRRDGEWFYGGSRMPSAAACYERFREDWNAAAGKRHWLRLDVLGRRTDRIRGGGYVRPDGFKFRHDWSGVAKAKRRLLGILDISYCWMVSSGDMPPEAFADMDDYLAWLFSEGSGGFKTVGVRDGLGRGSDRYKKSKQRNKRFKSK